MSDIDTVLEMTKNSDGTYEFMGKQSEDSDDQHVKDHRQDQSQYQSQQHHYYDHYSSDLESVYKTMAERNDEYLKHMRSAFDDSRKRMMDQMHSMTGRF